MDKVTLFDKTFRTFIPYGQISEAIGRVADRLNADYGNSEDVPVLLSDIFHSGIQRILGDGRISGGWPF